MTNVLRLILLFLLAATLAPVASAQGDESLDKRSFTCPLGGKKFTQDVGYSSFPLITLPDGSWLGDALIDVQIPVCPDNGLVILPDYAAMEASDEQRMSYGDYSVAERARLPGLIADPEYRALAADNRHAQAYWLATKLGRPAAARFHLLQRSTWATIDPMLRKRRVEQFAADGPALIDAMDESDAKSLGLRLYIVNAMRELGRFDEALSLLKSIGASFPDKGDDSYALTAIAMGPMETALLYRDDDRYPIDLLDDRLADDKCANRLPPPYDQQTPRTKAACKRRAVKTAENEALDAELTGFYDDPKGTDTLCAATSAETRSKALRIACSVAQGDRDRAAGEALAMQGRATAAQCQTTPEDEREGALFHACIGYDILVESQLGRMMVADDAAYAVLCGNDGEHDYPDRDRHVSLACHVASGERMDRDVAALLSDGAVLDARCPGLDNDKTDVALAVACSQRQSERQTAYIEKLATDDTAYGRECARFGDKPRDLFADDASELEVDCDQARYRRSHADALTTGTGIYAPIEVLDLENAEVTSEAAKEMGAAVEQAIDDADAIPERRSFLDEDSELNLAARDAAAAMIARAKAENTYPRRPKGQLD